MNLIPTSLLAKRWYESLERLEFGTLHFITPTGERLTFKGRQAGPEAEFAIDDWGVLQRMVARGDIAMGEDFIDGRWHTDDIERLFSLFLLNLDYLEKFAHGNLVSRIGFMIHNYIVCRNSKRGSSNNIQAHYDVGNEFYSLWLDKTMTYSSALYEKPNVTLEDAQVSKYRRILGKFDSDSSSVLEVGCGWGGFAEQAAGASHSVTGLTVSPAQHAFAQKRLGGGADIRLQDYRDVRGAFDMIVSIEMFEAVGERYWATYFAMIRERLKKGGKAVIQTITIGDDFFNDYRKRSDFIRHYVFPGGMLPSLARFREEAARAGLKCRDVFSFGQDYAQTLREWNARFEAQRKNIMALGHSEAFLRNWQFYLGICTSAFAINRTDVVQLELVHA